MKHALSGVLRGFPADAVHARCCSACRRTSSRAVVALAGDVVEVGPEAVAVNGQRLSGSSSSDVDSRGRALPHVAWGRYVVGPDELWLISTRVPNSWDSRYLGPIPMSHVWLVARPGWTVD